MTKKTLLTDLIALIDPSCVVATYPDLLCAATTFLCKLAVMAENVDVLRDSGVVQRMSPLLHCGHSGVINGVLRLLTNLAFDVVSRTIAYIYIYNPR